MENLPNGRQPTTEEALEIVRTIFDKTKRNQNERKDKYLIYWFLHKLLGVISGSRWKPCDPKETRLTKSFCSCVSVSDIGLSLYMLHYYYPLNKNNENISDNMGEKKTAPKKRWTVKENRNTIKKYSGWCKDIKEIVDAIFHNDSEKIILDKWILNLITEKTYKNDKKKNSNVHNEDNNDYSGIRYESDKSSAVYVETTNFAKV